MEHERFDTIARGLAQGLTRRGAIATFAALTGAAVAMNDSEGKKKKKKVTICRNGQTTTVTKKKKKKHLQPGDTEGPCPPPAPPAPPAPPVGPPPGPPPPPPRCPPRFPNFCERLDTCEDRCPAGKVFDADSCACACPGANTCCYCTCQTEPILCFPDGIASADACRAACADSCEENPETVDFSFAGGNGGSAACDFTNDRCNVTCTADPMTCPAGFEPDTCDSGTVCCPPEADGGCCGVDTPNCCPTFCCGPGFSVCCPTGGCCTAEAPNCCGACCSDSPCCRGDEDCNGSQVCAIAEGTDRGCCVDGTERSLGQDRAVMVSMAPAVPKRDAAGGGKQRARRKRRS